MSTAAFCALCYWMLRAWTTPAWALAGGLLAIFEFGPLSQWMNSYWGGTFAALAGCLVIGSLPRLAKGARKRDAAWLGIGLGLNILTRPYESMFLAVSVALFFLPKLRDAKRLIQPAAIVVLISVFAAGLTLLHNRRVTGKWTELPYTLSQYQYGVPASLTFLPDPVPHRDLTPQQALEYKSQLAFRGADRETLQSYLLRLEYRVRYYRFSSFRRCFWRCRFFWRDCASGDLPGSPSLSPCSRSGSISSPRFRLIIWARSRVYSCWFPSPASIEWRAGTRMPHAS